MRIGCIAIVSFVSAGDVAAEPAIKRPVAKTALEHLAQGNKLYNVRSFAEAAEEYKAGALIEPAPIFDYNLGQCYRKMKKYEDAIWHYERFIKNSPRATEHIATIQKLIAEMKVELESKPSPEPQTQVAEPQAPAPTPVAPAPSSVTTSTPSVIERRSDVHPWYADGLGWTLTASGVVAVAVGSGLLLKARSLDDEANSPTSQRNGMELRDRAESRRLLGAAFAIGGVALAATGAIKLALHPAAPSGQLGISISAHGLTLFGRF